MTARDSIRQGFTSCHVDAEEQNGCQETSGNPSAAVCRPQAIQSARVGSKYDIICGKKTLAFTKEKGSWHLSSASQNT